MTEIISLTVDCLHCTEKPCTVFINLNHTIRRTPALPKMCCILIRYICIKQITKWTLLNILSLELYISLMF